MVVKNILRDACFVFVLGFINGFCNTYFDLVFIPFFWLISSHLTAFVGFCIVAYWNPNLRLQHMVLVALLLWLLSAMETLLHGDVKVWLYGGGYLFLLSLFAYGCVRGVELLSSIRPSSSA